jgi:hypothetical protein
MSDDEKRELAGYVAPIVRGTSETVLRRRVKTFDRETGEVTGEVTMRQVLGGLTEVTALGIEVIDGVKAAEFICPECGRVGQNRSRAGVSPRCDACTFLHCADCEKPLPRNYSAPSMRRGRGAACTRLCLPCKRLRTAARTAAACTSCSVELGPRVVAARRRSGGPMLCGKCIRSQRPRKPLPLCGVCGAERPRSAATSVRARSGKPPMCKSCYSGDARRRVVAERGVARARHWCACGKELGRSAVTPSAAAARGGRAAECKRCARNRTLAALTPERRSVAAHKAWETRRAKAAAVLPSQDGGAEKTGADD